jgi:hypothetical protein
MAGFFFIRRPLTDDPVCVNLFGCTVTTTGALMAVLNGNEFEDAFFDRLFSVHGYKGTACVTWDKEQKIDRVLTVGRGVKLRRQIEVQLTLCVDHAKKLDRYLKKQRPGGRHVAEVYVEVNADECTSVDRLVAAFDEAVHRKFEGRKVDAGIYLLRIKPDGEFVWHDPVERAKFLWEEYDRMWNSPERCFGTVVAINGSGMIVRCIHEGVGVEYFAPYVHIVDNELQKMVMNRRLSVGHGVSIYPSGRKGGGMREIALSIRSA